MSVCGTEGSFQYSDVVEEEGYLIRAVVAGNCRGYYDVLVNGILSENLGGDDDVWAAHLILGTNCRKCLELTRLSCLDPDGRIRRTVVVEPLRVRLALGFIPFVLSYID